MLPSFLFCRIEEQPGRALSRAEAESKTVCKFSRGVRLIVVLRFYDVRPRKDKRGADLISDVLPFGRLWYGEPKAVSNAIGYAQYYSRFT
jgi:hypothetical protein